MLKTLIAQTLSPPFRIHSVDLGVANIHMPVADLRGNRPGKTLLVTAGMDGDEYAGICAAFRLVETFQNKAFSGRLIIVPVVNQPGYETGMSENPLDHKLPKYLFPGRTRGSASERLIHWLATRSVAQADAWHDMHSGAHDEHLRSFLWLTRTGTPAIDALSQKLLQTSSASRIVNERAGLFSKQRRLARQGCWFVMAESGELGEENEEDVARHVTWVKETMKVLGMMDDTELNKNHAPKIFSRVKQKTRLRPGDESRLLWWKDGGPYFVSL